MTSSQTHEYQGTGFKVTFSKEKCKHCAVCVETLPKVFNPKNKPWINTSGASKDEIQAMIKNCPSGALQFHEDPPTKEEPRRTPGPASDAK